MPEMNTLQRIIADWENDHKRHLKSEPVWGLRWGGPGLLKAMADMLAGLIRPNVLEIGCGGGKWTKWLFEMGAETVTAVDVHQTALDDAAKHVPHATYLLGDGKRLPVPDDSFDMVFTYDVLLHLPTELVFGYFQESYRVADRLVFQLSDIAAPLGGSNFKKQCNRRSPFSLGYIVYYSEEHVRTLLKLAGWSCSEIVGRPNRRDFVWLASKEAE